MERILPEFEHIGESEMKTLVFQALGAASVCWDSLYEAGLFDSGRASAIGEELMEAIERYDPEPVAVRDQPGGGPEHRAWLSRNNPPEDPEDYKEVR